MSRTRTQAPFALALLAATCLTPVAPATAAPGDRLGPEFQVNTTSSDSQFKPAVAMDADGDFVVVWNRCDLVDNGMGSLGCSDPNVAAQRYNAAGKPQGAEFQVSHGYISAGRPVVMDADGNILVVLYNGYGIVAQRFDATGHSLGGEIQVASESKATALTPERWPANASVAIDADGAFVVVWTYSESRTYLSYTYARRFNAAGNPLDAEFEVSPDGGSYQYDPTVAVDAEGNFVVAWDDWHGIFAQRFDASGSPRGPTIPIGSITNGRLDSPAVAMDADGDFMVAWNRCFYEPVLMDPCTIDLDVFAQHYRANGTPLAGEFQVNTTTAGDQLMPMVAVDADGEFVVAWNGRYGDTSGVFAQRYSDTGEPQGGEIQVNSTPTDAQRYFQPGPGVAMDADGDFVATWQSYLPDGFGLGANIFAQRFDGAEHVAGDFDGDGKADLLWRNVSTGAAVIWLMDGETRLDAGTIGTVPSAWELAGTGDFNGDGKADILWRNSSTGTAVVWQMNGLEKAASQSIGAPPLAWAVEQLRDTNGDGLTDIVWRNASTGATVVWRMSGFTRVAVWPIGRVNSDWQLR